MHSGDHCCHCDLYYLYHSDDSMMEARQTYADVTMNDLDFHGNLANHCDAHGHDHVQSTDCDDDATMVMVVLPNDDDAIHADCNDCAAMHVAIVAIVSAIDAGHSSLLPATHNHDHLVQNHLQFHVHV